MIGFAAAVFVILGFAAGHGERHADLLRHDFNACMGTRRVFADGDPQRGGVAGAREDQRTRVAAELFVLARIVEGNFEHEARLSQLGVEERYLYSREYVTHATRNCWQRLQVPPVGDEDGPPLPD